MTIITIAAAGIATVLLAVQLKGLKENTPPTWSWRQAPLSSFTEPES